MSILNENLARLNLQIPPCPAPVAAYVPAVRSANLIFVSGQLPFCQGTLLANGAVPRQTSIETAQQCARQCLLNGISAAQSVLDPGEELGRLLQINGFVQSAEGFTGHPQVVNGASELALALFGEKGKHARMALGASSLPLDAPVEIAFVFEVA
jgi:enamine deaminase RidA (YjgF/YER057c/UK114 family)